eukprot:CAMPEP_0169209948 /NCGR_PEP_ID=MMETSP1016-20121227/14943_1 /TAXON_ID=342587 /ORGANISM="Karlodinium micrum, Strain CCMP2283" /LENGTH=69 /DNA_ID=CAMNT_0009287435 /DNA_START=630 /DNA_END=839 /DNA_ORIENTATION=+
MAQSSATLHAEPCEESPKSLIEDSSPADAVEAESSLGGIKGGGTTHRDDAPGQKRRVFACNVPSLHRCP